MRRFFFTILSAASILVGPAFAQDAQDKVPLTVTRQQLQIIGQGLMELPYKTAADVMLTLQQQLNANDEAAKAKVAEAAKAAEPKTEAKTEEKPPGAKPSK